MKERGSNLSQVFQFFGRDVNLVNGRIERPEKGSSFDISAPKKSAAVENETNRDQDFHFLHFFQGDTRRFPELISTETEIETISSSAKCCH